ncbi:hypothetical protein FN846DRAFT_898169 [Sphaerosporella brunnea]|uniref:FAD-binding PCMH-type domain-containing protein n=1 Tax=Sphaerosporella brunnea TaxID=1250544 RepID=A0A5J5F1Y7_9PEZI|nr:hypothetical protein FN846DRAFT_898169 [Sphaerosporella brunnea]
MASPRVHLRGTPSYNTFVTAYFNNKLPSTRPLEIHQPRTTSDVRTAVARANDHTCSIGVRSGGHLFAATSLVADGILIDTTDINPALVYDAGTQSVAFGPGMRAGQLCAALCSHGRFFPFAHAATVGAGGFTLAGGQGWFMRGWGATAEWVAALEIVTAAGEAVVASETQHEELFYAARGGGQGFFGVVTKIFARTVAAKRIWRLVAVFDAGDRDTFRKALGAVLGANDGTPKCGVDVAAATVYSDREEPGGEQVGSGVLRLAVSAVAYADSLSEAKRMLAAFESLPKELGDLCVHHETTAETNWQALFEQQSVTFPPDRHERWQCDSILNDPAVPREELLDAIYPALCELPSRRSVGVVFIAETFPDEKKTAFSLPHQYYIATYTCWNDAALDAPMESWLKRTYEKVQRVGCGTYVADYDESLRHSKVMTDYALARFQEARRKWDPNGRFAGGVGFAKY